MCLVIAWLQMWCPQIRSVGAKWLNSAGHMPEHLQMLCVQFLCLQTCVCGRQSLQNLCPWTLDIMSLSSMHGDSIVSEDTVCMVFWLWAVLTVCYEAVCLQTQYDQYAGPSVLCIQTVHICTFCTRLSMDTLRITALCAYLYPAESHL